jgi:hypothetical protein
MAYSYGPTIVKSGLVLALDAANRKSYPGSGATWADISRNGYNSTLTNGAAFTIAGGGAIAFDGANDRVDCGTNFSSFITGTNSFTIECWVYPASTQAQYADIWGNHTDNFTGVVCQQNFTSSNQYTWGWGNGVSWATSGISNFFNLNALRWNHLVAIRNGSSVLTYLDGLLIDTTTNSSVVAPNSSFNFQIGTGYNLNSSRYLNGWVSNFRIYSRALSSAEVLQNYTATKGRYGLA